MALIEHIGLCLLAAFGLGAIAGWLSKQRSVALTNSTVQPPQPQPQSALEATEREMYTTQIYSLQNQLETAQAALQTRDEAFHQLQKELIEKVAVFSTFAAQTEDLQAQLHETKTILQQNTESVKNLESAVHTLRIENEEKERQLSQLLQLDNGSVQQQREAAEDSTLNEVNVNLQNIAREKDDEILHLQARIAELEPMKQKLTECTNRLQELEAQYQASVREKDATIIRLQAHIHSLEASRPQVSVYEAKLNDITARHQAVLREKDAVIARLQARLAGLDFLLRRQREQLETAPQALSSIHHRSPTSFGRQQIPIKLQAIESDLADLSTLDETSLAKLQAIGITNRATLLAQGASPDGRHRIAEQTGISPALILQWVNQADLLRLQGMSRIYTQLLNAAGVDSVSTLTHCTAETLHRKFLDINAAKHLSRILPILTQIRAWIQQAKELPSKVIPEDSSLSTANHPS